MNGTRRRRLLARARAVGTRARADGGRAPPARTRGPSSIASWHDTIPSRGPLAALTVPGAIGGWMLALEAAKAHGGTLPLDDAARPRHPPGRAKASRSRATSRALTAAVAGELEGRPGLRRRPSWSTASRPPQGTLLRQPALAATLEQLAHAGLDDFYRGDVAREIAADLDRIGSPVTRADLERCQRHGRRAAVGRARRRHALQHAAADAGPRLADDPRAVRPARRQGGRKLRPRPRPDRGDQARAARARPHHHRSRPAAASARPLSRRRVSRRRGRHDRPPQGRRRGRRRRARATPSGWARPTRPASSSPTSSRSTGSSAPACVLPRTGVLMQNRGTELLARARRAQRARARPAAAAHAQPGARRAARRPRHGLRHHGRRRAAADPGGAVHAPRALPPAARRGARRGRAG